MLKLKHIFPATQEEMFEALKRTKDQMSDIVAGAFDTETTGLHPVLDKPFLFQCGYYTSDETGYVYTIDLEKQPMLGPCFIKAWNKMAEKFPVYAGHHVVFDLHMLKNINVPYEHFDNLTDTQFWIRASSNAVQQDKGGEPLALKDWAVRHITPRANEFEKELATMRAMAAQKLNQQLLFATGMKKKDFEAFFKDKTNDWTMLPNGIKEAYKEWHDHLPAYLQDIITGVVDRDDIRYDTLPRENVSRYAAYDIDWTLNCYMLCQPIAELRDNLTLVERENQQIRWIAEMERVGFQVDKKYLAECKAKTREYLIRRRQDLCTIAGEKVTCSQNQRIVELLACLGVDVPAANKEVLELKLEDIKDQEQYSEAVELIETVLELRHLEKFYSTYICRWERQLVHSDRIYTSINQVQAVTGRVSCDFQQFPKEGIKDCEGNSLFNPRQMIVAPKGKALIYLDYSAQELRTQALWCAIIGAPDYHLTRAYCPYGCHRSDGTSYDLKNFEHIAHWNDGSWLDDKTNEPWKKTDPHAETTKTILRLLHREDIIDDPEQFHLWRYRGKTVNFASQYGASEAVFRRRYPKLSDAEIKAIAGSYNATYTGVATYQAYAKQMAKNPYVENLYGVKYWGQSGHNVINTLVQGTCAYMTKDRINAVCEYMHSKNLKSKFCMQIHDELCFEWDLSDPLEEAFEIQKILQNVYTGDETDQPKIPFVSDMEISVKTWLDKVEVSTIEEAREVING